MNTNNQSKRTRVFYLLIVLSVLLSLVIPSVALAQDPGSFSETPLFPDSSISVEKSTSTNTPTAGLVGVIVKLQGDSLATYTGDISGLAATSPSVTGDCGSRHT